jgi:hypothetical protein
MLSQSPIHHKALSLPDSTNRSDFNADFAAWGDCAGRKEIKNYQDAALHDGRTHSTHIR